MKRFSWVIVVVVIAAAGVLLYKNRDKDMAEAPANSAPQNTSPAPSPTPPPPVSNLKTYFNVGNKFSFQYPDTMQFYDVTGQNIPSNYQQYFARFGLIVASASLSQDSYPKTNFSGAYIIFAVNDVYANEKDCATYTDFQQTTNTANPLGYRSIDMTETKTVGGVAYHYAELTGAAAGTRSDTHIYHALHNGVCYEANLNLFRTNVQNFPAGTVTEVDASAVWKGLEDILATLKFN